MSTGAIFSDSNSTDAAAAEIATKRSYPKTHANYWKSRLEHRTYTRDGKAFEVAEWSVRIHFKGVRKSFDWKPRKRRRRQLRHAIFICPSWRKAGLPRSMISLHSQYHWSR